MAWPLHIICQKRINNITKYSIIWLVHSIMYYYVLFDFYIILCTVTSELQGLKQISNYNYSEL